MEKRNSVPFAKPVTWTREAIEIIRQVSRGERLSYDGEIFQLPLPGGEGKAIRSGAETAGRSLNDIDLTVSIGVEITDDLEEAGRRRTCSG